MLINTLLLFGLGLCGSFLLAEIRMPAAEIVGPIVIIGTLRALHVDLPYSPGILFPIIQILIGIFIGSKLNKNVVKGLKLITVSALIIIAWALSVAIFIGYLLEHFLNIDLYSAMLAASMGGLPEIMVIALASGANIGIILVMQMVRMLGSAILFPLIVGWLEVKNEENNDENPKNFFNIANCLGEKVSVQDKITYGRNFRQFITAKKINLLEGSITTFLKSFLVTLAIALAGGLLFYRLGVPAGLLIGSMVFIASASVTGIPITKFSPRLLDLLLVFIGITIADNISPETFTVLGDPQLLLPILLATFIMFATSFGISWIVYKLTGWDYPTSFLASAPGGFTVIVAMAIKHERNVFNISILHLCRLLAINIFIPIVILFFMNR